MRPPSSHIWQLLLSAPPPIFVAMLLAPFLLAIMTRILSGRALEKVNGKNERTVRACCPIGSRSWAMASHCKSLTASVTRTILTVLQSRPSGQVDERGEVGARTYYNICMILTSLPLETTPLMESLL
jgi:hypothetical protein